MPGFGSECAAKNPVRMDEVASRVAAALNRASELHEEILERDKTHTNWKQERIQSRRETFL
jgi:hypothetical protein